VLLLIFISEPLKELSNSLDLELLADLTISLPNPVPTGTPNAPTTAVATPNAAFE